ncbi:MAG: DUF2207 domain-containing protein [Propionibacteriaceae bacterium]|jgi:hypothetical protein|nr:DUF2207 domain-containing protein [Propionibacteriaceae bacterium]
MRFARRIAAAGLGAVALLGLGSLPAQAADEIAEYDVTAVVDASGAVQVEGSLTLDAAASADLTQAIPTLQETTDRRDYVYTISGLTLTADGAEQTVAATQTADALVVTLPKGHTSYTLSYAVVGAATLSPEGATVVTWDLVAGLSVPVASFTGTMAPDVPAGFDLVDCAAGDPQSPGACTWYAGATQADPVPEFHHDGLPAGQVVRATLRFPQGIAANQTIRERWTFDRAFSVAPAQLLTALAVLVVGGVVVLLLHRRFGRDVDAVPPTRVAEFHPVGEGQVEFRVLDDIRPGLVGTVLDERVDPVDVTATLLDLAVRGHLVIRELPRAAEHAFAEWTFERVGNADAKLSDFELTLLDAVAPRQGEAVAVSALAGTVGGVIDQVQSQLYDEVVARGWFANRPDQTRGLWARLGWALLGVSLVATVLLAAFSSFGMTGVALIAVSLGLIFVAAEMPARTAAGVAVLGGMGALTGVLATQPVDELPKGNRIAQVSSVLPYAVVLGGAARWLDALAAEDDDAAPDPEDVYWYHAPETWNLSDLPASLRAFVTTVQGTLFTR